MCNHRVSVRQVLWRRNWCTKTSKWLRHAQPRVWNMVVNQSTQICSTKTRLCWEGKKQANLYTKLKFLLIFWKLSCKEEPRVQGRSSFFQIEPDYSVEIIPPISGCRFGLTRVPIFLGRCDGKATWCGIGSFFLLGMVSWCGCWTKNRGFNPPNHPILKGFGTIINQHYVHHPFWGPTPIFGNIHISVSLKQP